MCKIKLITVLVIISICGLSLPQVLAQNDLVTDSEDHLTELPETEEDRSNLTLQTRTGRILKYSRIPGYTLRRRQPVQIRSRADHFPLRPQIRRVHNGGLATNQQPPPPRYGYESLKSSKYVPSSKGSALTYGSGVKGNSLKQQLLGVHPNGLHIPALSQQYVQNFKASPYFNGKVVIHPPPMPSASNQQTNLQSQQSQAQDNTYPKYVKPQQQQSQQQKQQLGQQQQHHHHHQPSLVSQQQQQQPDLTYPEFKQFPIPDQQQMQKFNEQHDKYLQQQKFLTPRDPMAYYQQQYQQQQQQQQLPQHLYQQQQHQPSSAYSVHQPAGYAETAASVSAAPQKPVLQQQQIHQYQHQTQTQPPIPIHEVSEAVADTPQQQTSYGHAVAPGPAKMYSVYEENDMTELQNNDYQTAAYDSLEKEAQEYLRFMNTNEYFLPKRDPNYRVIDEENDRRQQYNLLQQQQQQQQQQASSAYKQQPASVATSSSHYQQSYQPQTPIAHPQQVEQIHYGHHPDTSVSASTSSLLNQPIQVSKLFYQDETNHNDAGPSTVVRTSYQTAYNANQFVVNSQDNQVAKYQNTLTVSTQSPVSVNNVYSQVRQSPQSSRTPEPLRFEFTERDAMVGGVSYTHAPQKHLKYKSVDPPSTPKLPAAGSTAPTTTHPVLSTTLRSTTYLGGIKPIVEVEDDPEDEEDMQPAGSHMYGRHSQQSKNKAKTSTSSTTETPPSEQTDTEDYCERICAIVEDEHEEIVCGSDGYMYTSEAQMECYASCLHIDITIQGKGSCSAR